MKKNHFLLAAGACLATLMPVVTAGVAQAAPGAITCGEPAHLVSVITAANNAGSPTTINLAGRCLLTAPATTAGPTAQGQDGLPIITGDVTIVGGTIARSQAAGTPLFRILEVAGQQRHPTSEPGGGRSQQVVTLDQGTIVAGNRPNNCEQQSGVIAGCTANPI